MSETCVKPSRLDIFSVLSITGGCGNPCFCQNPGKISKMDGLYILCICFFDFWRCFFEANSSVFHYFCPYVQVLYYMIICLSMCVCVYIYIIYSIPSRAANWGPWGPPKGPWGPCSWWPSRWFSFRTLGRATCAQSGPAKVGFEDTFFEISSVSMNGNRAKIKIENHQRYPDPDYGVKWVKSLVGHSYGVFFWQDPTSQQLVKRCRLLAVKTIQACTGLDYY